MIIPNKILRLANGLYTHIDLMRILKIDRYTWAIHKAKKLIPEPTAMFNGSDRRYYTEAELKAIKQHFKETPTVASAMGLINMREASERIGISYSNILRLVRDGRLPAPTHKHGSKRSYYKAADIPALKRAWKVLPSAKSSWEGVKAAGYYSGVDASKALDMPYITFQLWQKLGKFPKPTRQVQGRRQAVYNATDIEAMRVLQKVHGYKPMR